MENKTNSTFRDFIPEGEPTDALGNGFQDFVPAPVITELTEEEKKAAQDAKRLESLAKAREAKKNKVLEGE